MPPKTKPPELPSPASAPQTQGAPKRATHHLQVNLDGMPVDELLQLRAQIDSRLPAKRLADIDLEQELVLQLKATQELQMRVLQDGEAPANQMAQVSNAVQAALQNLVKLQEGIHTSERIKQLELILIDCIKELPFEVQDAFLTTYAQRVEHL